MSGNSESGRVSKSLSISRAKGKWNDRVVTDTGTQVPCPLMSLIQTILFYCEHHSKLSGYSVSFRRAEKDGLVAASGICKFLTDTMTVPDHDQVVMQSKFWSSAASFSFCDREYRWKDTMRASELRTDRGNIVAHFKRELCAWRKDGELEIYVQETDLPTDVIIISFIMYLYRRMEVTSRGGRWG